MMLRVLVILQIGVCGALAQPRTVCEALADLTDLNGKQVKIRGVFGSGHTGQELFASPPCPQPTIRDGWVWHDSIRAWPADGRAKASVAAAVVTWHEMAKSHPNCKIMATLTGRLETRDHFEVQIFPDGRQVPIAYKWYVAGIAYWVIDHLEAVAESPQEIEQEAAWRRRTYAERLDPAKGQ